jgi:hypothetical protein
MLDRSMLALRLTNRSLFWLALPVIGICLLIQLLLGTNLVVLSLALLACLAGFAAFRLVGPYHSAAWLAFFFVLGNVLVALVAKTVFLQPLDSYLFAPLDSFLILAIGSSLLLAAFLVSLVVPVGKPIFKPLVDKQRLRFVSTWTFFLGSAFWFLNRQFQDPDGSGFGGVSVFWNLVLMAVIARTALLLESTNNKKSIDGFLLFILACAGLMGLIDNSKAEVALPVVAYFATSVFYRGGMTRRQLLAGVLGLLMMIAIIGPLIHTYRILGIQGLPWRQRVVLIERGVKEVVARGDLTRYQKLATGEFVEGYYNYFGAGRGQMFLGRYAAIQQIDPVIATVERSGVIGGAVVWPSFQRLIPSFVYPNKPKYIEGYILLVKLGLIHPEGGKFPTVPLLAQTYASYGMAGVLLITFLTFTAFMLVLKKFGWHLHRNIFAIFFFSVFIVVYANQGDLGQYAESALRTFPLCSVVLWILTRPIVHKKREAPEVVESGHQPT